jgi:anhydro-N-acetylmuramic acid kinase
MRQTGQCELSELASLGHDISLAYATAINEALLAGRLSADDLAGVAAHGQTLFHAPPKTIQWFDPSIVAHEVGCPVVSDFRRADCAAGGQGAPLVPFGDFLLFRNPELNRVLLNIGGVANLTYLRAGGTLDELIAFDTGPGNCISDFIMRMRSPGGEAFDADGTLAMSGKANESLGYKFIANDYFQADPPKTTDVPTMLALYEELRRSDAAMSLPDELATACYLTAKCIAEAIRSFTPKGIDELIASGGGTRNQAMMKWLHELLPGVSIRTTDELGVPSSAKEALVFALLGAATLDGVPANVPSATGAQRRVVLGSITPKP